jgi:AcrR family transcriptional regulator
VVKRRWLNREIVVNTAAQLANEAGTADALTLSEVARALDVRTPSLYNHLDGLEGLKREMTLLGVKELARRLRQAAFGKIGRDALLAMADAYRVFAHDQPGIYALTLRAPDPADRELTELGESILQILSLVLASYGLQGEEALHAIRGYRAVLHGFVSLEMVGGYELPLSREDSYSRLVVTYIDGLTLTDPNAV